MDDIEMLRLAASSAGLRVCGADTNEIGQACLLIGSVTDHCKWSPLYSKADALWLAAKLKISVFYDGNNSVTARGECAATELFEHEDLRALYTCRAITLAAAYMEKKNG